MRVVTTCHKEGYELYGDRFEQGWLNWPETAELYWYTEGFTPNLPRATIIDNTNLHDLQNFKNKYNGYAPPAWQWDVVKFSNKVFAVADAFRDYKGIGVWLDADCITYEKIPDGYIESLLPEDCYMAMFKRSGMYTETGLWIVNCGHEYHNDFMRELLDWYETGAFKKLHAWHDCEILDATVRRFEKAGLIKTASLSGEHEKEMHPMAKVELAKYLCHLKGRRKALVCSPENEYAKAFFDGKQVNASKIQPVA